MSRDEPEVLYRPPSDGEDSAHAHKVRKMTRRQVKVERAARDGTLAAPEKGIEGTWTLSRQELEQHGFALHGTIRTRFYLSRKSAEGLP